MKHHLSNGCSFSTDKPYLSCHQRLGQRLMLEPTINLAKGGRGNDRILNTTMHWFLKNPERITDTFVSVGWTTGFRWDYISTQHPPLQWGSWHALFHDSFVHDKDVDLELASAVKLYTNILSLQYFLKYHKIPYVFYWALTNDLPENFPDLKLLKDGIDLNHFYNFKESDFANENVRTSWGWDHFYNVKEDDSANENVKMQLDNRSSYVQSHFEYVAKNGWTKSASDGHPNMTGHHNWADNLYNFVQENKLCPK